MDYVLACPGRMSSAAGTLAKRKVELLCQREFCAIRGQGAWTAGKTQRGKPSRCLHTTARAQELTWWESTPANGKPSRRCARRKAFLLSNRYLREGLRGGCAATPNGHYFVTLRPATSLGSIPCRRSERQPCYTYAMDWTVLYFK